jgi:putative inorganic carbon (hco3(-)) transporter
MMGMMAIRTGFGGARLPLPMGAVPFAAGAFALGAGVTAAAARFGQAGPVVLMALALAPALVVAVIVRPLVGVALVLLSFPFGSVVVPTPGLSMKLVEAAVLGVAALVVIRRLGEGAKPLPWMPQVWWATALFAWTLVATPSAVDATLAIKQVVILAAGIVFVLVVLATVEDMDDLRRMLGVLVAIAVGIAVAALSQGVHFQSTFGGETVSGRLQGAFEHPNELGLFSAIAASIAAGLAFGARTKLARSASVGALVVILVPLLLSLSRGAWIGCGLAFAFFLLVLPEARRALLVFGIPLIVVAAVIGSFGSGKTDIQIIHERAQAIGTLSPYDARSTIYAEALREIKAHPLTGEGPGNFPVASARAGSEASTVFADHAHDLWLTWGAEEGIPAVAIIVALVISLVLTGRRVSRAAIESDGRRDRALVAAISAALIAMLGQGLFDYPLRNAVLWFLVWGLIGALLVCARHYRPAEPPRGVLG